ncbi:unnamed protein product, partial [Iphiclides podalirius]
MNFINEFLLLLTATLQCEGSLSLLGGILSTAHEHIHSRVHDVAGAVLGTINKGLNLNLEGHLGVNQQRQPGYDYETTHGQDVISNNPYYNNYGSHVNEYRPNTNGGVQQPINNNQRPYVPNSNGYNRPAQNSYNNFNEQYENQYSGYPNNKYEHNQQNPNNNNFGYNQPRPDNQNYGAGNNYPNNQNQGYPYKQNQGNPNNPNYSNNNDYHNQNDYNKPNSGNPIYNGQGQKYPKPISTPAARPEYSETTTLSNGDDTNEDEDDKSTENTTEDLPLFIPLGPNDYVYGGDKINVTAPKRQTNNKPQTAQEEDFPIDIRFKDE